jgi:UDP-N-acetylmuramoyl-L-alanyl-D-glutamate--2,6-diaminopimelate ligase
MKLKDLLADFEVTAMTADPETEIHDIRYDSRAVGKGDLFVAVEGYKSDGHVFIAKAMENGAAAVLCSRVPTVKAPYVLTQDTRKALALASAAYFGHPAEHMAMIGVTGTNGKTTSTTLIQHMLEKCRGEKVGLIGTIENAIGDEKIPAERTTPESYDLQRLLRRMVDAGCTYCVMEVSSHALVLERVAGIRFKAGLFTNLTQDHLDFHGTMEAYAEAKALLFSQCDAAAINLDDPWADFMTKRARCPVFTYSVSRDEADVVAKDIRLSASGVKFCAMAGPEISNIRLGIPGRFSVSNALTVIACGHMLGISLSDMAKALSVAKGVKGRVEVVPAGLDCTVVIDYAHTPDALEKVLKAMREGSTGRLVVVFGCGGDRDKTKRPIMGRIAAQNADFCVVTSDNPRTEDPDAIIADILEGMKGSRTPREVISNRPEAIQWALDNHRVGDIILLAGKGHETYQEVNGVKNHMDEREIVAEHLKKMRRTET